MKMSEYEFRVLAGALVRKNVRTLLDSEIFYGRDIRWMEDKGWLESVFRVRGEYNDSKAVENRLEEYIKRLS